MYQSHLSVNRERCWCGISTAGTCRCKSALRDCESLVLGQVPVILCGTGSEGYSDDYRGDAHSSNETKLIARRRERA